MQVAEDGDWTVENEITIDQVVLAMQHIPEKYATVVRLYLMEGYDHDEISGILDISGSTCRTRLLRGKGYLKEILKNQRNGTGS
jgi:RNA polymerase sigma-70 factor (ECF subfamily)